MEIAITAIVSVIGGIFIGYIGCLFNLYNQEETFEEYIPDFYESDDWRK